MGVKPTLPFLRTSWASSVQADVSVTATLPVGSPEDPVTVNKLVDGHKLVPVGGIEPPISA